MVVPSVVGLLTDAVRKILVGGSSLVGWFGQGIIITLQQPGFGI